MTFLSQISRVQKCIGLALGLLAAAPALAQNPFEAAIRVDDTIVTNYEIDQRVLFMRALNAHGNVRQQAIEALVNERLQSAAGLRFGTTASPSEIEDGIEEFAARAGLGAEQFLRRMAAEGVAPETVRDFIANGITWRNLVGSQFRPRVNIDDIELNTAMEIGSVLGGGVEILLAEIIIPRTPDNQANLVPELARLGRDLNGNTALFSEAASRFSAAPTRENGGVTGWRLLSELPEGLRSLFESLRVGQVTEPIPLGGGQAYALFQLRGEREVPSPRLSVVEIDYASIPIAGGRSPEALAEAGRIRDQADNCNDLNGVVPYAFERQSIAPSALQSDVAMALRNLDDNEMSFQVTRNDGTVLLALMLCDRVLAEPAQGRDAVRERLASQELQTYANSFLEELRAQANIQYLN